MSNITANDALGLFEAYHSIYEPKEVIEESQLPPRRSAEERKKRSKEIGDRQTINDVVGKYNKGRQSSRQEDPKKYYTKEDVFDIVLEFLQVEGYAETLEEAEWIMANLIDEEAIEIILGEEYMDEATAMAKRGYDETQIRNQIAKSTGGGTSADRASALEKKSSYGNSNVSAQRSRYARAQRTDFRKTTSSSPGLHGYGHNSNDPSIKAKQSARGSQRGVLTPNEKKELGVKEAFEAWLDEALCSYEQNRKEN